MIFDEATSALDFDSEMKILDSLEKIKAFSTLIVIAHKLNTIKKVDYIYVLDKGQILEEGIYEDMILDKSSYIYRGK